MKGQSEFAWIFSLIIGAMILFLAIYAATKIFSTGSYLTDVEIQKTFDILLNPFSSIGSTATMTLSKDITMPYGTEMNFSCDASKDIQKLSMRKFEKGKIGDWTTPYTIKNKYIFADYVMGKKFSVFSKSFFFPWRVDDMIYIISNNYCFVDAPNNIYLELNGVNASNIKLNDNVNECGNAISVCFPGNGCNISVSYNLYSMTKFGETIKFADDASMYAAIFSDKQTYDCNMKRLLNRLKSQTSLYSGWARAIEGCQTSMLISNIGALKENIGPAISNPSERISDLVGIAAQIAQSDNYDCRIIR